MTYKLAENISWRQIEDQVLILDPRHNRKAHELNPVASFIWIELTAGTILDDILVKLVDHYADEISKQQLEDDFNSFINSLVDQKLLSK
jgi:hypothetical protein